MGTSAIEALLLKAQELAGDPSRFLIYFDKPVEFAEEVLGVKLWKKQEEILIAARDGRRVTVRSGHGTGKTFAMAVLTIWWTYGRGGRVITTAPTKEHVEDVLWTEINALWTRAKVPLPGSCFSTTLTVAPDWYAKGFTTNKASAFQGRHHPLLLVVLDEAAGIEETIHTEAAMLATGDQNVIVMIGNPTITSGTFYESFKRPELGWFTIHVSCLQHPNVVEGKTSIPGAVSQEWVEERRVQWGEHHPFWFSRVIGEFPKISTRGVIPLAWIERQQDDNIRVAVLEREAKAHTPRVGGLDVARYGDNKCVYFQRRGDAIEDWLEWGHTSLMETANRAAQLIAENELEFLVVDASGIGAGVVDRLLELGLPVQAYNGGHRAFTPASFSNRRSEMWWRLRELLERGKLWLPESCTQLVTDLLAPTYEITATGRIKVETKEMLLDRGVKSPDHADALALCFAMDSDPLEEPATKPDREQDPLPHYERLAEANDAPTIGGLPYGY